LVSLLQHGISLGWRKARFRSAPQRIVQVSGEAPALVERVRRGTQPDQERANGNEHRDEEHHHAHRRKASPPVADYFFPLVPFPHSSSSLYASAPPTRFVQASVTVATCPFTTVTS